MEKEIVKRYSEAFKQQVVKEYEGGASVYSLRRKYGIGSAKTIERWVKRYGREGYRTEKVVIQTVEDQVEFQAMKRRIQELEAALAEQVLEVRMLRSVLEAAEEHLEMDLKKTFGPQQ